MAGKLKKAKLNLKRTTRGKLPQYELGGIDPVSMGLSALDTGVDAMLNPMIQNRESKVSDLYSNAEEIGTMVDVNQASKGAFTTAIMKNGLKNFGILGGITGLIGGIQAVKKAKKDATLFNQGIQKQQFQKDVNNRMSTMTPQQNYMPVAKQGGFTIYKGETHKGPNGGILTDEQGNPTGLSNKPAIALTEKDEVARYDPNTGSTYIYSEALGFAKPATDLVNKYKLNKSNSEYKYNPLLKVAVDKQFDNLQTAQEFAKETKTSAEDAVGMFKNGGKLTASKAKEILKDGTAHKHKLTKAQRMYFQAISHGMKPNKWQNSTADRLEDAGEKKELGGLLPEYHEGGGVKHTHDSAKGYAVDENGKLMLTPEGFVTDYYGEHHSSPERMEELFGGQQMTQKEYNKKNGKSFGNYLKQNRESLKNNKRSIGNSLADPINDWLGKPNNTTTSQTNILNTLSTGVNKTYTSDFLNSDYLSAENILQRNREFYDPKINKSNIGLESRSRINIMNSNPIKQTKPTGTAKPKNITWAGNIGGINENLSRLKPVVNPITPPTQLAPGPKMPTKSTTENYTPTLSPLGHVLSGIGQLADYRAMGKAKPLDVTLPRVGAERIDLAQQRLANDRNAANARAINTSNVRGAGLNAGATMANTAVANTGVNRLLGQQNAESLMMEENTNAQMRQQANMMNAELAAQEGLFNTQSQNAYRMAKARMNPLGNLSRTAASYFADNASYGKGYDIARMTAPNAEIYKPQDQTWVDRLLGEGPGVEVYDKSLYTPEELSKKRKNR